VIIGIASVVARMPDKDPPQARGIPNGHPGQFYLPPETDASDPILQDPIWESYGQDPRHPAYLGHPSPPPSLLFRVSPPPAGGSNNPGAGVQTNPSLVHGPQAAGEAEQSSGDFQA
jgi:hypothetical protein